MVKISTLLYICDNLEDNEEKLIDVQAITRTETNDYQEVWDFLDNLVFDPSLTVGGFFRPMRIFNFLLISIL